MLGIGVASYYVPRFASCILDDLEASALALSCGDTRVVLISVDCIGIDSDQGKDFRKAIEQETSIPWDQIFLSATHTHTGPLLAPTPAFDADLGPIERYAAFLGERLIDVGKLAVADLKPAKMGFIVGRAPERVAYIRRYKMKDGSTWTCPPINDPNIDHPIGELDQRVNVLRFDREGSESIVLFNFGLHADTINSDMLSPYSGVLRRDRRLPAPARQYQ